MTHVGLNLVFLVPGETGGMEVAARELIEAMVDAAPGVRFTCFVNRVAAEVDGPWQRTERVVVPVDARRRVEWVRGEQQLLPRLGRHVDLMHSLASTAPAWGSFKRVVTIHDLIYMRFPEAHQGIRTLGMRVLVPLAARRSDRIICVSQSARDDLVELLGTPPGKIDVVPHGYGARAGADALSAEATRTMLELGERRVLLSLSAKRPHKNLAALISALAQIPAERRPVLVIPGYPTWHEQELWQQARELGVADDLRMPGWLSDVELEGVWRVSDAFVFPSLYEGFGLPVIEAMARGVPVACANASSLPEVAGDGALLFEPGEPAQIAAAIERILGDAGEAARLRELGLAQAARFSWHRSAELTLDSYSRALGREL